MFRCDEREAAGSCPGVIGAPQSLQNFAPGERSWPHAAQATPRNGAPQFAQKRPAELSEHRGHLVCRSGSIDFADDCSLMSNSIRCWTA
jgi:hypothetical protein